MTISKKGQPIQTLDEWSDLAGPKRKHHWQDNRSAKEAARSWLAVASPALPGKVAALLLSNSKFDQIKSWTAEPEARLPFDDYAGEPRNADLLVRATDGHGDFLIAVEAKADEPFGETVADALATSVERKLQNPRSNGVARVERLAQTLFGPRRKGEPSLNKLRYQLLTATAGVLAAGGEPKVERVIMLVQEFITSDTEARKHATNSRDLRQFVRRLSHNTVREVEPEHLYGPFMVAVTDSSSAWPSLFIGKTVSDLR